MTKIPNEDFKPIFDMCADGNEFITSQELKHCLIPIQSKVPVSEDVTEKYTGEKPSQYG